jgi:hypothetical protein
LAQQPPMETRPDVAEQLLAQANESRRQAGVGMLQWDQSLASAALEHCRKMAAEGELAHRYGGEASVEGRAAAAGAHFSLIEENIGLSTSSTNLHQGWMNSPEHRQNLLNPSVDHIGIAVVRVRGVFYAAADFARMVPAIDRDHVEAAIGSLLRARALKIDENHREAREACPMDRGLPAATSGNQPQFVMRWQNSDLSKLPPALEARLKSHEFRRAAVGSCPATEAPAAFTVYRVAVLLY